MAIREVRGIFPGLLAQEEPGINVFRGIDDLGEQGKVTSSGLVTVPVNSGYLGPQYPVPIARPTLQEPAAPVGVQTAEAAKQEAPAASGWLVLGAALLLLV